MAITHIASATAAGGNASATTGSVDSTGADLAVISVGTFFGSWSFSDSKGNTYTALTNYTSGLFNQQQAYCLNPTVGSGHTFTVGNSADVQPGVGASVFAGVDSYDSETGTSASANTTTTGSITPPEDGCLLTTGFMNDGGSSWSVGSSFTLAGSINANPGTNQGAAWGYKIQTTAGAENPTWTSNGNNNCRASIAVFLPAAGGGGGGFIDNTTPILRHIFGMAG